MRFEKNEFQHFPYTNVLECKFDLAMKISKVTKIIIEQTL